MLDLKKIHDRVMKFINFHRVMGDPEVMKNIMKEMFPLIKEINPDFLVGNERTSQGLLALCSVDTGIPSMCMVSKCKPVSSPMRYFDDEYFVNYRDVSRAVVIEPVITDSWSLKRLRCGCKSRNLEIVAVLCVVDLRAEKSETIDSCDFKALVRKKEWLNLAKPT